jgi:hypothetical protein
MNEADARPAHITQQKLGHRAIAHTKGYVGNLPEGYIRNVPLPRVPRDQSTFQSRVPHVHRIPHYYEDTYGIPTYKDTCRIGERVATANSPQWQSLAVNT